MGGVPSGGLWAGVGSTLGAGRLWVRTRGQRRKGGPSHHSSRPRALCLTFFFHGLSSFPLFILFMSSSHLHLPQDTKSWPWSLEVGGVGGGPGCRVAGGRLWTESGEHGVPGVYLVLGGMGGGLPVSL